MPNNTPVRIASADATDDKFSAILGECPDATKAGLSDPVFLWAKQDTPKGSARTYEASFTRLEDADVGAVCATHFPNPFYVLT